MDINLKELSTPQLTELKRVILNGPIAKAEANVEAPVIDKGEGVVTEANEVKRMEDKEKITSLEKDVSGLKEDLDSKKNECTSQAEKITDLESKATKLDELTTEIGAMKKHNGELVTYWFDKEVEAEKSKLLKARKAKVESAGLDLDIETDAEWLEMSDEVFEFTMKKMGDVKKVASASNKVDVPDITTDGNPKDSKQIVREGLAKRKVGN